MQYLRPRAVGLAGHAGPGHEAQAQRGTAGTGPSQVGPERDIASDGGNICLSAKLSDMCVQSSDVGVWGGHNGDI